MEKAAYSKGLLQNPSSVRLLSNRAATYLNLHAWNLALQDAEAAIANGSDSGPNIKAAYRRCVSLLYLQRPEEALLGANTLLAQIPLSTSSTFCQEVQTLISDLQVAIEEQRGQYNLPRIRLEMKAWPHSDAPHRHMDFSHPLI
jgi:hypothetical protein